MTSLREGTVLSSRLADAEVFLFSIKVLRAVLRFDIDLPSFRSLAIYLERTCGLRFLVKFFETLNLRWGWTKILSLLHSTHVSVWMIFWDRLSWSGHVRHVYLPLCTGPLVGTFLPLILYFVLVGMYPSEAAIFDAPATFGWWTLSAMVMLVLLWIIQLIPILFVYSRRELSRSVLRWTLRLQFLEESVVSGVGSFSKMILRSRPIFKAVFMRVKLWPCHKGDR